MVDVGIVVVVVVAGGDEIISRVGGGGVVVGMVVVIAVVGGGGTIATVLVAAGIGWIIFYICSLLLTCLYLKSELVLKGFNSADSTVHLWLVL